ncbi:hypothetical protein [Agromyces sp. LHK192]|uniref:hypothetical protein n=1 Tax=Agromyces sp. LHK192 TaxID=2498704 RepID=UPI000FD7B7A9|nr:hypothetical protein [Agromyces sp. LHK192]
MITLTWLLIIAIAGGVLALIDGILRVRGRGNSVIGIIEIVVAALFLLSLFVPGIPWGPLVLAVALIVVVVIGLVFRGRQGIGLTIGALALLAFYVILVNKWLVIPGIN